ARAAVGGSMTVARLAARHGAEVVPAGTELGFLAPLPLACLAPPPEIAATLARWGIRRLGDLARLPVAEVATRLGPAGAVLVRTARGEDERPLAPQALGGPVEEAIDLENALDALEPLLFVLRGLVERAVARVGLEGIGIARLGLALGLGDRSRDERAVALAAPTRIPTGRARPVCGRSRSEAHPGRRPPTAAGSSCVRSGRRVPSRCSRTATGPTSCAARAWAGASWARRARGGWPGSGGATAP